MFRRWIAKAKAWIKRVCKGSTPPPRQGEPPISMPAPDDTIGDNRDGYPKAWLTLALKITGTFEGRGYDQVSGNFDGQGLSAGILQWNYGQGSLQSKILRPFIEKYGASELNSFFNVDVARSAYFSTSRGTMFAVRYNGGWFNDWRRFLSDPRTIDIQRDAARGVANRAYNYCEKWGIVTLRAFCFFFDVCTQNGSMAGHSRPTRIDDFGHSIRVDGGVNKERWKNVTPTNEQLVLWQTIRNRVKRNKWASDVLARKGTIIFGRGFVHGKVHDFESSLKGSSDE